MTTLSPSTFAFRSAPSAPETVPRSAPPAEARESRQGGRSLRVRVQRPGRGLVVLEAEGEVNAANEPRFAEPLRHRFTCTGLCQ